MSDPRDSVEEEQRTVPLVFHEGESRNVLSGLFDVKFRRINAVRMAPLVYFLVMVISALACAYLTVLAFRYSTGIGLLCLFVIAPVIFLVVLVLTRFVLEFILSLLILPAYLSELSSSVLLILGTTTDIVGTTTDISTDTSGLGIVLPLGRLRRAMRGAVQENLRKADETAQRAAQKSAEAEIRRQEAEPGLEKPEAGKRTPTEPPTS